MTFFNPWQPYRVSECNPIVTSKSRHGVIVCELRSSFLLPAAAMVAWHHPCWRTFRFKVTTEEKEG